MMKIKASVNNFRSEDDFIELISNKVVSEADSQMNFYRTFVTLSFAQSLDGSISLNKNMKTKISNYQAQVFNHRLRAVHDAILIGINTLISDDPRLTVRYINGNNPIPIIVDSQLRFPLSSRLMKNKFHMPVIATTHGVKKEKVNQFKEKGMKVLQLPSLKNGWVNLSELMKILPAMNIKSVMVEGGARIMSSFLQEGLVNQVVLNISPMILGGFRGVGSTNGKNTFKQNYLKNLHFQNLSGDLFIRGDVVGEAR